MSEIKRHPILRTALLLGIVAMLPGRGAKAQVADFIDPDVMLIIDSSGSMDWVDPSGRPPGTSQWEWSRQKCEGHSHTDENRTAWQKLQDTFLGSIPAPNYKCAVHQPLERPSLQALRDDNIDDYIPENVSEYKSVSYPTFRSVSCLDPTTNWDATHGQCIKDADVTLNGITACKTGDLDTSGDFCLNMHPQSTNRRNDGILDTFGSTARFGALTYDNLPKCWDECWEGGTFDPHASRWDYGPYRNWKCGLSSKVSAVSPDSICVDWNAGARGGRDEGYAGAVGGLVGFGMRPDDSAHRVERLLDSAEPLFCSPLGAMIDDVGHYFAHAENARPKDQGGTDYLYKCRPKIVVLISDGQPTGAFEFMAGGCTNDSTADDWDPWSPPAYTHLNPPASARSAPDAAEKQFDCPWRSSAEEAGELFDLGIRMIGDDYTPGCEADANHNPSRECEPVYLVVVGFNVPDVDCSVTPGACYEYSSSYVPCWKGLANEKLSCTEAVCLMSPRTLLNEIACQGWPYQNNAGNPVVNYTKGADVTHSTNRVPPWLADPPTGYDPICGDNSPDPDAYICWDYGAYKERALFVNNVTELKSVLNLVLTNASPQVVTRTDLLAWNNPEIDTDQPAQFRFTSGYQANPGRKWQGVLTRQDMTCDANDDLVPVIRDVAGMVAGQGSRRIYTYPESEKPADDKYRDLNLANASLWLNNNPLSANGMKEIKDLTDCDFLKQNWDNQTTCSTKGNKIKTAIASALTGRGLTDIYNATPVMLGRPFDRLDSPSYRLYRNLNSLNRHPHLFVATNDGVLHAIDNDKIKEPTSTPESWGFVPYSVVPMLAQALPVPPITFEESGGVITNYFPKDPPYTKIDRHMFLMDSTPVARDVLLIRRREQYDSALENNAWRALVFGTTGKNARGIYALDVTDAVKVDTNGVTPPPKLRFEINPDENLWANNKNTDGFDRAALRRIGRFISSPSLAYVNDKNLDAGGTATNLISAAAIVPGGWKDNSDPNAPGDQEGNSGVYIVRLGDGKVLKYLEPMGAGETWLDGTEHICKPIANSGGGGNVHTPIGLMHNAAANAGLGHYFDGAQLVGKPVVPFGTRGLKVTTEAFIGDDRGRIWLIDMHDKDPANWCLEIFFDTMLSWNYPYQDCTESVCDVNGENCVSSATMTSICAPNPTGCFHDDCCTGTYKNACDPTLARNMNAPRAMILGAPAAATDEKNRPVLIFGTGQFDDLTSWSRNRVISVTDDITVYSAGDASDPDLRVYHKPIVNWWIGDSVLADDLPGKANAEITFDSAIDDQSAFQTAYVGVTGNPGFIPQLTARQIPDGTYPTSGTAGDPRLFWNVGEKMIGRPVVFDGVAYFTTFVPLNDSGDDDWCGDISSRIWAVSYNLPYTDARKGEFGKFWDATNSAWVPFKDFPGEVLSGVQVVKEPSCDDTGLETFVLLAQKVNAGASLAPGTKPPADVVGIHKLAISPQGGRPIISVRFDSWSLVF